MEASIWRLPLHDRVVAYANRAVAYTYLGKDLEVQQDVERAVELGVDRTVLERQIERLQKQR